MCISLEILPQLLEVIISGCSSQKNNPYKCRLPMTRAVYFYTWFPFHSICPQEFQFSICWAKSHKRRMILEFLGSVVSHSWLLQESWARKSIFKSPRLKCLGITMHMKKWGKKQVGWFITNSVNLAVPFWEVNQFSGCKVAPSAGRAKNHWPPQDSATEIRCVPSLCVVWFPAPLSFSVRPCHPLWNGC